MERVAVETSVYKPDALAPRIKQGGVRWIHKAARVKDAIHAQEVGADAIILVGLEGAGIKNPEQLPTMTTIIWGRQHIKVPLKNPKGRVPRDFPWVNENSPEGRQAKLES